MDRPYRVAVAGCHRMLERNLAGHNWAAAFAAVPATDIVAVFDKGADTRRAFVDCWGTMPAYDNYERMLHEVQPDLVCVATRQTMHADQIEMAAGAGVKGILCDKPLATSMGEVQRIVAACERHGVRFAFGLDRRWFTYYAMLSRLIRDGTIGDVRAVIAFGMVNLVNHGCHWFDRVLEFAGDPEIVWVSGQVDPLTDEPADSRRRIDPPGNCRVQFSNGVEAYATSANYTSRFDMGFDVQGSRGRLVVVADGLDTRLWTLDDQGKTLAPADVPTFDPVPAWPAAVQDLVDAIDQSRPTRCDIAEARRATEISFATHQSSREDGRRVAPSEIDPTLRIPSFPWGNE